MSKQRFTMFLLSVLIVTGLALPVASAMVVAAPVVPQMQVVVAPVAGEAVNWDNIRGLGQRLAVNWDNTKGRA